MSRSAKTEITPEMIARCRELTAAWHRTNWTGESGGDVGFVLCEVLPALLAERDELEQRIDTPERCKCLHPRDAHAGPNRNGACLVHCPCKAFALATPKSPAEVKG